MKKYEKRYLLEIYCRLNSWQYPEAMDQPFNVNYEDLPGHFGLDDPKRGKELSKFYMNYISIEIIKALISEKERSYYWHVVFKKDKTKKQFKRWWKVRMRTIKRYRRSMI